MNEGQQSTHSTCTGALLACMGNILISSRAERHTRTPRAVVRRRTQLFSSCSETQSCFNAEIGNFDHMEFVRGAGKLNVEMLKVKLMTRKTRSL